MLGSCGRRPTMARSKVKIAMVTTPVAIQTQMGTSTLLLLELEVDDGLSATPAGSGGLFRSRLAARTDGTGHALAPTPY